MQINFLLYRGRGGNASGRAMAFCPSRPGWNPGTNFSFFQIRYLLYSRWAMGFSVNEVIDQTMRDTSILLSVSYPN